MLNYSNSHLYELVAVRKTDVEKLNVLALEGSISLEYVNSDNVSYFQDLSQEKYDEYYQSSYDSSNC